MAQIKSYDKQMAQVYKAKPDLGDQMLKAAIADGDAITIDATIRQLQIAKGLDPMPYRDDWAVRNTTAIDLQKQLLTIGYKASVEKLTDEELKALEALRAGEVEDESDAEDQSEDDAQDADESREDEAPQEAEAGQEDDRAADEDKPESKVSKIFKK